MFMFFRSEQALANVNFPNIVTLRDKIGMLLKG